MNTDETLAPIIWNFCETYGYSFNENYSGRGMYGETCVGIIVPRHKDAFELGIELGVFLGEHHAADAKNYMGVLGGKARQDQLGLGQIVYFPSIKTQESPIS